MKAAPSGYARTQIRLHWAVAALVVVQYLLGQSASAAFEDGLETGRLTMTPLAIAHFVNGSLIFLLVAWRLMLRNERGVPAPPPGEPAWQSTAARVNHRAMYALLLALPITGGVAWGAASEGAALAHESLRALLLLAVVVHVAAAVYGQFVQHSGVLDRIRRPAD